jgi:hypothetical protein
MGIPLSQLENVVNQCLFHLCNVHQAAMDQGLTVNIDTVDFQVELIYKEEGLQLSSITHSPTRLSTSETPETVERSTQEVGPSQSTRRDSSQDQSDSAQTGNSESRITRGTGSITTNRHTT